MEYQRLAGPVGSTQALLEWGRRRLVCGLLTGLMGLSVVGVLLSFALPDVRPYRPVFLTLATACVLLVAVLGGAWRSGYGRLILAGLACCALGDFVGPHDFILGAVAFLAAHMFFVAGFWVLGVNWRRAMGFAPVMFVVDLGILAWLHSGITGGDRLVAYPYILIISLMVIFAFSIASQERRRLILAAAVLFYISDVFVARWRFTDTGSLNGYFCYPLYYTACVLFAWTACMGRDKPLAVESRAG